MKILEKLKLAIRRFFGGRYVTNSQQDTKIYRTCDIFVQQSRDIKSPKNTVPQAVCEAGFQPVSEKTFTCPYCKGKDIVKKGRRKKKFETVQLYYCNNCKKVFTPQKVKGKQFPLSIILDGLSLYNTGWTLEESCKLLKEKDGLEVKPSTLSDWVKEFQPLCRYSRMREFGLKLFSANQVIQSVKLFHRQVFEFKYHRAKIALILQEFKHTRFEPLREFLDLISVECPHQLFRDGARMSELKPGFDLSEVIFRKKHNFACRIAELVLQAVADNKLRHKAIQDFMIANDSVSVACEVPVYLKEEDVEHMQKELGFVIPDIFSTPTGEKISAITGHIDILQIRNGAIHILDYKPDAEKHRPIEQLTLYAIALSRLTGVRLYEFKCGWFDNESYFEFFPLHVIYKLRKKQKEENPAQCKLPLVVGTTNGIQI